LGTRLYDKAMGTGANKMLGLDRSVPKIWAAPGAVDPTLQVSGLPKEADDIVDRFATRIENAANEPNRKWTGTLAGLSENDAIKVGQGIQSGIDGRGGVASATKAARIAGSVIKIVAVTGDIIGGGVSIASGALTLKDGIRSNDKMMIAGGSLSIASGSFGLLGAAGTFASAAGFASRITPFFGPIGFLVGGVLGFAGTIVSIIKSPKLHKLSLKNWEQIKQFQQDGFVRPGAEHKYIWLQTYLSDWGQRDAPKDQSIFDFRREEAAVSATRKDNKGLTHLDYKEDGKNHATKERLFVPGPQVR
ncbi:hypothetical protein DYL61_29375, partial [Pseudomonas nabeulensis]